MANLLTPLYGAVTYFGRSTLSRLKERLALAGLVRNDYDSAAGAPGLVVQVPSITAEGTASIRAIGGAATASDLTVHTRDLTLNHIYYGVRIDDIERFVSSVALQEELAGQCAFAVAQKADSLVAGLWTEIPYEAGEVDGSALFNATDKVGHLNTARKILSQNRAPLGELYAVINPTEAFNLRALDTLTVFSNSGSAATLREGELGSIYGFRIIESQQVPNATLSTAAQWGTSPLINNSPGPYPVGTTAIAVDALGTGTIKAGSTFLLGSYRYSVTADATIVGNAATLSISPDLQAAAANNDPLTQTPHSAAGSMNLAFSPDGLLAIARTPSAWPAGSGVASVVVHDEQTGLGIRVSVKSNLLGGAGVAFSNELVADLLYGARVIRPELVLKLTGSV